MLEAHQVGWPKSKSGQTLSGKELAQHVREGVARVEVEITDLPAKDERRVLVNGSFNTNRSMTGNRSVVAVSPQGSVRDLEGSNDSWLVATTLSRLAFVPLPHANQQRWTANRRWTMIHVDDNNRTPFRFSGPAGAFGSLNPGFGYRIPGPRSRTSDGSETDVEDHWTYKLGQVTDQQAIILGRLASQRTTHTDSKPAGGVTAEAQYVFDRKRGVLSRGQADMLLEATIDGVELRVPLQLTFLLKDVLTQQEITDRHDKQERDNQQREAKQKLENDQKLKLAIATLKNGQADPATLHRALNDLTWVSDGQVLEPQHSEVALQLNRYLKAGDESVHNEAISAAEKWAGLVNIPVLLDLLPLVDQWKRDQVLRALAATGGNEKAATIAARLLSTNARGVASDALRKMKSFAEAPVLPLLDSSDHDTVREACRILADVGGEKSRDALGKLHTNNAGKNGFDEWAVKDALDRINQRLVVNSP